MCFTSSSKRYSEEFKLVTVKLVTEKGHIMAEVAARLGTTTHSLYDWIKRGGKFTYRDQMPERIYLNILRCFITQK